MDRDTYRAVFSEYAPRVRAYLIRRGLSTSQADEISQEVMLTVWNQQAAFDPEKGSLSTWVFTIARNRLIDSVRRERRPAPDPDDPCWVGDRERHSASPETHALEKSRAEVLAQGLAALPSEQRAVLEGLYFQGKSMSELAEITGIPLGTIKTRARTAMRLLRGRLGNGGEDES